MSTAPWPGGRKPPPKRPDYSAYRSEVRSRKKRQRLAVSTDPDKPLNKRRRWWLDRCANLDALQQREDQEYWYSQSRASRSDQHIRFFEESGESGGPRPALDALPNELLLKIFRHLPNSSLAALCRTVRSCRPAAEDLLYENVNNLWGRLVGNRCADMVSSLARNPKLAELIRTFDLRFDDKAFLYAGRFSTAKFERFREKSTVALFFAWNIQKLTIHEPICSTYWQANCQREPEMCWLGSVFNLYGDYFDRLKNVSITTSYRSIESLACLFYLPMIHSLTLHRVCQVDEFPKFMFADAKKCTLQDLQISGAIVHHKAIEKLLRFIKELHYFGYHLNSKEWRGWAEVNCGFDSPAIFTPHSWTEIASTLAYHKQTLESIGVSEVYDDVEMAKSFPDGRNLGALATFTDYPMLRRLDVSLEAFLDKTRLVTNPDLKPYVPLNLDFFRLRFLHTDATIAEWYDWVLASIIPYMNEEKIPAIEILVDRSFPYTLVRLSTAMKRMYRRGIDVSLTMVDEKGVLYSISRPKLREYETGMYDAASSDEDSDLEESSEDPSSESDIPESDVSDSGSDRSMSPFQHPREHEDSEEEDSGSFMGYDDEDYKREVKDKREVEDKMEEEHGSDEEYDGEKEDNDE